MTKSFIIKYENPKHEIKYCINNGKSEENLKEYWRLYELPQRYKLLEILQINNQEKANEWLRNHKLLSIRETRKNLEFLNNITNGNFLKNMYDVPFCRHCGKKLDLSNVDGYTWQCFDCDEDFYNFETITDWRVAEAIREARKNDVE